MHRRLPSASVLRQKRNQKRNVRFNVMVAGSGGCGKTTLINTLCGREIASTTDWLDDDPNNAHRDRPIRLRTYTEELNDPDVGNITLSFIETSGLGESKDSSGALREALEFIEQQFDDVLAEESRIKRNPRFIDHRLHTLVYMIEPTGHGLRELDVEFMRMVGSRVNVIPVLAKADTLTRGEILLNKRLVREDIARYSIPIYQFTNLDEEEEEDGADPNASYDALLNVQESVPFSVIGTSSFVPGEDGRPVLIRQYPWGSVNVEDPNNSDLALLRDLLLYSHMNDLKESTYDVLYESYRTQRLSVQNQGDDANGSGLNLPALPPTDASSPSYLAREEQLRLEEERLQKHEMSLQTELEQRRSELQRREQELRELEERLRREAESINSPALSDMPKF